MNEAKTVEAVSAESITNARKALERVWYWLAMGDEGTEASLPDVWGEATPSEQAELSGLMEEVRVAAVALGGLQEPDEDHPNSTWAVGGR